MKNRICLAPKALSHVSLGHIALGIRLLGTQALNGALQSCSKHIVCRNHRVSMIGPDGVEVNRAFSAGTFRVSRDLGRTPQARRGESVLWRTGNEFCALGAKHRPKIPRVLIENFPLT